MRTSIISVTLLLVTVTFVIDYPITMGSAPLRYARGDRVILYITVGGKYSEELKHHDLSGQLRFFIHRDGRIKRIVIDRHFKYPELDTVAVETFKKWNFGKRDFDVVIIPVTFRPQ